MIVEKVVISGEMKGSKDYFRGKKLEIKKRETKNIFVKFCKKLKKSDK